MKAIHTLLILLFFCSIFCNAQVPYAIPYQAAARDIGGELVINHNISLRFGIYPTLTGGTLLYQETHNVTTNALGLFTANIGQGTVTSGAFSSIVWSSGNKYLEVEMDITGGSNYTSMGRTQMLSVPYSLYSEKTSGLPNGTSAGQILIWDGLQWVAGNVCSLFNSDPNNCGSCNNVCPPNPANGSSACVNGVCTINCNSGFGNCDGIAANGCEANFSSNTANCGACGVICPARANAAVTCINGICSFVCNPGFADCNSIVSDGCEVNLNTSTANCSACGVVCPAGQSCIGGICGLVCPAGQTNCGGICRNLSTDVANCGACGNVCGNPPNAFGICNSGVCSMICNSGFANCDGIYANGCEINLMTSINNCGNCGVVCPTRANAINTCVNGVCSFFCNTGFANCNGLATDGCEVNLMTSNNNCGNCGNICPGSQTCVNGVCQ